MMIYRLGWRQLYRHPWQTILMILGITLGVAVIVAVDLANTSASRAFDLSTEAVIGKATHQISGGPAGIDQAIYTRIITSGFKWSAAPVIQGYVSASQLGGHSLQLIGLDPFSDAPFRSYLSPGNETPSVPSNRPGTLAITELTDFLTRSGTVFISQSLAKRYQITIGDSIDLISDGHTHQASIGGFLIPGDRLSELALDGLIIADIATAQELTGRTGKIDRIDLILPDDPQQSCFPNTTATEECQAAIRTMLPPDARIQTVADRSDNIQQMTNAFRVNLTALSLLALVVGMFLIYNTMTFSVIQRRRIFGILRCLGISRREIFYQVSTEAVIISILGTLLGIVLGIILGQTAVRLVTQTINDLYFTVTVRGVQLASESIAKGWVVGLGATLLSALPPAWEAASVSPRTALTRSTLETKAHRAVLVAAILGAGLIAAGIFILYFTEKSLVGSFGATFGVIVGFAMLVPITTKLLMQGAVRPLGHIWGSLGRMAPRDVVNSLSRTSIAVMALMVAISVTIGVSLMVSSFRGTVATWLEETLRGDIYISAPSLTSNRPSATVAPEEIEQIRTWPGIARMDVLRSVNVDSPAGNIQISATDNHDIAKERLFLSKSVPVSEMWAQMLNGAVIVSEPFANRHQLPQTGGKISIYTKYGLREFPVIGIYYDYSSTQGTVIMTLPTYQSNWQDLAISAISLRMSSPAEVEETVRLLQDSLTGEQNLVVRSNRALRSEVLDIFDRTFTITQALQILATLVAFLGILSALLSLEIERQHEIGILRSLGLTVKQLWQLILLETGLMGAAAGLLAMPCGYFLSLILIFIINRRSFGWTLQMQLSWEPFVGALLLALSAALLAGIYPAYRMGKMIVSEALRSE